MAQPRLGLVMKSVLWLFTGILYLQIPIYSAVFCIGSDGHISMEYEVNGQCVNPPQAPTSRLSTQWQESDPRSQHCGECVDVSIPRFDQTSRNFTYKIVRVATDFLPVLRFNLLASTILPPLPDTSLDHHSSCFTNTILQSLQSVILLN